MKLKNNNIDEDPELIGARVFRWRSSDAAC